MGFGLIRRISITKQLMKGSGVPKRHLAVYVGVEQQKWFVIPIGYLMEPLFQDLLSLSEEEFIYEHPTGGLTIPCSEETFIHLTSRSRLNGYN